MLNCKYDLHELGSAFNFHWELEHRLLTIIFHLILLLASWLMFWRLYPAVSFSVAGFVKYSFGLFPSPCGFPLKACFVVISPERAYPGPFLVVTCCGGGGVGPPPPPIFFFCFFWAPFPPPGGRFYKNF